MTAERRESASATPELPLAAGPLTTPELPLAAKPLTTTEPGPASSGTYPEDNPMTPLPLLPVADGRQIRAYLRDALRGRWGLPAATVAVMVGESALGLVGPIAIGRLTQAVVTGQGRSALVGPVVLLAVAAVLGALTVWASGVMLARVVLPEVARLREDVVATALTLPVDTVEAGGSGDLVSRVSGDVERVTEAAQGALGTFVSAGLAILATLVGLASLDWRFAVAGLLAVPFQVLALRWYLRTSRPVYAAGRTAEGHRTSALLGAFAALPTVRALRLGGRQYTRVEKGSLQAMEYEFRATRTATRFSGRLNVAEYIGLGAILLVAYVLVHSGTASVGAATTAALFFAGLFDPINAVLGAFDSIQQAGAGLARLIGVTAARPAPAEAGPPPGPEPVLDMAAVGFGYGDGADVVHDVDIRLEPGRHVAIVGTTGSGKSTVATLMAGIRQPRRGRITFGGVPLTGIDGRDLHRTVALVTQETHLFAGTVADNLRLARPDAPDDAITAALAEVGADGWVSTLPDGLATPIGAGGHPLTAGQAQHLALARLLLLDPAVVILDEATAEGGSDTARVLDGAARTVVEGRGALVVAHRLSQTASADTILVMDAGRVVERGTHDELRAAGGPYAALWGAWSRTG
ncbi:MULTISPECIES: ABC transporter ATP-binding protein [unclassified Streptomyces]|uniref:ABC transporter ATP-binding protein n=1 Tax=unclassified Streptomyces TaxID=2593676 RepID=UPI002E2C3223|nr:ABC transporter ATP-binding protein [Streptomyces sp. NBC_00223]